MIKPGADIRVKETGVAGILLDYEPGDLVCGVELNSAFVIQEDNMEYRHYKISEIEEVYEVADEERKNVAEHFDLITFNTFCFNRTPDCANFVIIKCADGLHLKVFNNSEVINKEVVLNAEDEEQLRFEFGKMKSFRWPKIFESKYEILDGYNWTMKVFSGSRFYSCEGSNVEPDKLAEFCLGLVKFGVLSAWNINEGPFMVDDRE